MHKETARKEARKLRDDAARIRQERKASMGATWNHCDKRGSRRYGCTDGLLVTDEQFYNGLCEGCLEIYQEESEDAIRQEASERYFTGDDIYFANEGSALRSEDVKWISGVAHCPQCLTHPAQRDNYCRKCGHHLNRRIHPCPNCRAKNVLTDQDVHHGYQCDGCADAAERGIER